MRILAALLLLPVMWLQADSKLPRPKKSRRSGPVSTVKEAKVIAEQNTSGVAVSARRVHLNGASGGWEVTVHMPKEERGWRCIVDADTHQVYTKDRIPNPSLKGSKRR